MDKKRRFKAKIAGKDYTIVGSLSATQLNTVVDLVNQQIEQLTELAPELTNADRCVLMAVNAISDQLTKEKRIVELEEELAKLKNEPGPDSNVKDSRSRPTFNGRSTKGTIAESNQQTQTTASLENSNQPSQGRMEQVEFPFRRK